MITLTCCVCKVEVAQLEIGSKYKQTMKVYCFKCDGNIKSRIEELELELKKLKAIQALGNKKTSDPFGNIFGDIFK